MKTENFFVALIIIVFLGLWGWKTVAEIKKIHAETPMQVIVYDTSYVEISKEEQKQKIHEAYSIGVEQGLQSKGKHATVYHNNDDFIPAFIASIISLLTFLILGVITSTLGKFNLSEKFLLTVVICFASLIVFGLLSINI